MAGLGLPLMLPSLLSFALKRHGVCQCLVFARRLSFSTAEAVCVIGCSSRCRGIVIGNERLGVSVEVACASVADVNFTSLHVFTFTFQWLGRITV